MKPGETVRIVKTGISTQPFVVLGAQSFFYNSYQQRPTLAQNNNFGVMYFDAGKHRYEYWDGTSWVEGDGATAGVNRSGTFADKPTAADIYVGFRYFCTDKQTMEGATNGIEIIHKGSNVWVDALGRTVS